MTVNFQKKKERKKLVVDVCQIKFIIYVYPKMSRPREVKGLHLALLKRN